MSSGYGFLPIVGQKTADIKNVVNPTRWSMPIPLVLTLCRNMLRNRPKSQYRRCMGWGFRRSINLGPLRINASKSGIGYSVGGRGFRIGKDAKGRRYTAASIPGTGIYNRNYAKAGITNNKLAARAPTPQPVIKSATQSGPSGGQLRRISFYGVAALVLYFLVSAVLHLL
jgi:hypothetical protein